MKSLLMSLTSLILVAMGLPAAASAQTEQAEATEVTVDLDERFEELGYQFMSVGKPGAIYKRVVIVDNMAYTSGHISIDADGKILTGKVGDSIELEAAQVAAERSAIAMLSSLKAELGSLNRIKRIVKTTGMVNCTGEFTGQSQVVNGFSKVFKDLLGAENGVGARSAVGMSALPRGAIVEVEAIFELHGNKR